jgi:AmmeMemoRadiSam system protein B
MGLALAARRRGLHPELIDLRNSGDTAGDRDRVVGYGSFAYYYGGGIAGVPA